MFWQLCEQSLSAFLRHEIWLGWSWMCDPSPSYSPLYPLLDGWFFSFLPTVFIPVARAAPVILWNLSQILPVWKREWTISYTLIRLWRKNASKKLNSQHFSRPKYHLLCEGLHWGTELTTSSPLSPLCLIFCSYASHHSRIMYMTLPHQDVSLPKAAALILAQKTLNISWMKWN